MKLWHLKNCPLFAKLREEELGAIFDASRLVTLEPKECVPTPRAGDESAIYVVKRGYVKLTYIGDDGSDAAIMILGPGDMFGSVVPGATFGETCQAMTGACLARLSSVRFEKLMQRFPGLAYEINKANFDRIYRLQVRVGELLMRSVEERLALTLLELDKVLGEDSGNGERTFNMPLSHRDLAQLVGSSREMVTHVMGRLRKKGLVDTSEKREIILKNLQEIKEIARK